MIRIHLTRRHSVVLNFLQTVTRLASGGQVWLEYTQLSQFVTQSTFYWQISED